MARRSHIAVSMGGHIAVVQYDHDAQTVLTTPIGTASTMNDHNVAALLERPDHRLIAAYSDHNSPMRCRVSMSQNSSTSWGAEVTVDSADCTYPRLLRLSAENTTYLIYRQGSGGTRPQVVRTSTDNGATWSAASNLITGPNRPYLRLATNGVDRIDFFVTNGHPRAAETPDGNSLYHLYYQSGDWFNSAGVDIGDPPFVPTDGTLVWDGTTERSWIWDVGYVAGAPVALFTTFVSDTDHRYRYAKWNGSAWATPQIATAGKHIYETSGEEQYTAGGCFSHDMPDVFLAREVVTNRWELERWTTADGGDTWSKAEDVTTSSPSAPFKNYRPYKVEGGGPFDVVWLAGGYNTYIDWSSSLMARRKPVA